jgi:hypothetical protein
VPKVSHIREIVRQHRPNVGVGGRLSDFSPADILYQNGVPYLAKQAYNRWLENSVYPKFKKGTLATMRGLAYVPDVVPNPIMIVSDIQEISYMAPLDESWKEPRCVVVQNYKHQLAFITYPPSLLRPLQPEELKLVHARDQARKALEEELGRPVGPAELDQPDPVG